MEQRLTQEELQKLRDVSIHSVLGLTNNGRRIMIRCPIHQEKQPSMVIYPDNTWHCFGCRAHGSNAIDLLTAMGATFVEALEELTRYI